MVSLDRARPYEAGDSLFTRSGSEALPLFVGKLSEILKHSMISGMPCVGSPAYIN